MAASLFREEPFLTKSLDRDKDGHREYRIVHLVSTDDPKDGPQVVAACPGLPAIGSVWNFGNDLDSWAFCWPTMSVRVHQEKPGESARIWAVEQVFSTKPFFRCQESSIEDPLLEPQKISGSFVKYTREATADRCGRPIRTSSHEIIRGPQVEFDANRPTVRIEQNVADLDLELIAQFVDRVNDSPLWGLPARCVKLSNVSWEVLFYGVCYCYYKRVLDFDISFDTFDREVLDEGTKVLRGKWTSDNKWETLPGVDECNPKDFQRYKDYNGENCRVILNGHGVPWDGTWLYSGTDTSCGAGTSCGEGTSGSTGPGVIKVEYYKEADFTLLGIPTSLSCPGA